MTTPNIEELIERLHSAMDDNQFEDTNTALSDAATTLQSQAERIKELESEVEMWKATANAMVDFEKVQLRAQLEAIAATEPIATINDLSNSRMFTLEANGYSRKDKLYTRPMPAQDVTELVEAFEYHIEQTRPIERSTIALSKYKGAK